MRRATCRRSWPIYGFGCAQCDAERSAGQAAISEAAAVVIRDPEWGKWGGRVIADLVVDGRSLAAALIAAGYGRVYDGGKRAGWCE